MPARLSLVAPFDFALSLRFLCAPPVTAPDADWPAGADFWNGREYRRVIWLGQRPLLLILRAAGLVDRPAVEWQVVGADLSEAEQKAVLEIIRHMLSADVDLTPFYAAARLDPVLTDLREAYYGLKLIRFPSLYECLVSTVLSQQTTPSLAAALKRRLVEQFGPGIEHGGRSWHGYPAPRRLAGLSPAQLQSLQIPERKAASLIAIARSFAAGKVDEAALRSAPVDQAVEELCQLRGVGVWTAEISLLRGLGHTDVIPADDSVLQKTVGLLYGLKAPATAMSIRRRWRRLAPCRGYAALYLWFTHWAPGR